MIRRVITIIFVTVALILIVGIVRQIYDALQSSKRLDAAADNFSKLQEENVRLKKKKTTYSGLFCVTQTLLPSSVAGYPCSSSGTTAHRSRATGEGRRCAAGVQFFQTVGRPGRRKSGVIFWTTLKWPM